ncbi:MAG: 2-keto-4-pentenoate hydratase/2-oxohepta-3-ene-1,7-dioic acid hydratase in catechol pathway, partial [Bacteroidia bacterium]
FSGTPEGVGPVAKGDLLEGFIGKQLLLKVKVR